MFLNKDDENIIRYRVEKYEDFDEFSFNVLKANQIDGVITLGKTVEDGRKKPTLLLAVSNVVHISNVLGDSENTFEDVNHFVHQAIETIHRIENYLLPKNELIFSPELCFAEERDGEYNLRLPVVPASLSLSASYRMQDVFAYFLACGNYKNEQEKACAMELISYLYSPDYDETEFLERLNDVIGHVNENMKPKKEKRVSLLKGIVSRLGSHTGEKRELDDELFFTEEEDGKGHRLFFLSVRSTGVEFPLVIGPEFIGTDPNTCSICFKNETHTDIEKEHCKITISNERCYVRDLESTSGTFINGKRIDTNKKYELKSADVLKVGCEELIFSLRN